MITIEHLTRALAQGNTPPTSDYDLNPEATKLLLASRVLRAASVLIPVIKREGGLHIILTKRASLLKHHPGQIAFPGGKAEAGETPTTAALREAEEEIGLPRGNVALLGQLPSHETITNFTVTPVIGMITDFTPRIDPNEVEEAFEVPLDHLMAPANMQIQGRMWQGHKRQYYTIPYGPYYIWGATARILKALADRVNTCK